MNTIELHYFLHGLVILMIGLVAGFPFASAIKHKNGKEVAWRVVHSGASVAGTMLIAIGALINRLSLSSVHQSLIFYGIVLSTYILVLGMGLAAISGERGIGNSGEERTSKWKIVYYCYGIGAVGTILSVGWLIIATALQVYVR